MACAGAVFGPATVRPLPYLAGHSPRDAGRTPLPVPAAYGPLVATRAEVLRRTGGLDPRLAHLAEVDLSLAAARDGLGRTVLEPRAVLTSRPVTVPPQPYAAATAVLEERWSAPPPGSEEAWAAAGLQVAGYRNDLVTPDPQPDPRDRPLLVPRAVLLAAPGRLQVSEGPPRLRWTVDLAAPPGAKGRLWGDTHYGRALADALERRGQHVAVDPRHARHRPTRDLDDVLLVLRGLDEVRPRPGLVNLLWVISHPDLVTAPEAAGFDAVYAASSTWAAERTARWGVPVRPLLQCTDPALFGPDRADPAAATDVLFVGNSRGVYRSALRNAVAAGATVTLHGAGWDDLVPAGTVASRHVDNAEVGRLYASAGVVLNDHWEDMRRDGFLSNRLFDAAACGARIISDDVPGLTEVFGDQVQVFRDEHDMALLLAERDTVFPDAAARRALAERIRSEHSFDARAGELLDAAVRLRAARVQV